MLDKLSKVASENPAKKITIYVLGYFLFLFGASFILFSFRNGLTTEGIWNSFVFCAPFAVFLSPYLAYLELRSENKTKDHNSVRKP